MQTLLGLRNISIGQTTACINGKWVPARPENYKKTNMTLVERFKHAWAVFSGTAEAFTWPEGQ